MSETSSFSLKRLLRTTIFASGTFAWWFLITIYFEHFYPNFTENHFFISVLMALFYGAGAISTIPGSMICERINRRKFLFFCFTFGIFATALLLFVGQNLILALLSSILLGTSLGLGFPSSMSVVSDCTVKKERARFMSVIVLETFIMVFLGIVALDALKLGLIGIIAVVIIVRSTSFFGFSTRFCGKSKEMEVSWSSILAYRDLVLYLLPWLAFNFAGELVVLIWSGLSNDSSIVEAYDIGNVLRMALIAFFGPLAGVTADRVGRKPPIIFALVILGIGFGLLALDASYYTALLYLILSGVAWSLLMVSYFAVFGDIASSKSSEKYYALGISTPLIAYALVRGILPCLSITSAEVNILSPVMSILLFLAIIPLLYVPDTLSADMIHERKMREHVKKIGKLVRETENK